MPSRNRCDPGTRGIFTDLLYFRKVFRSFRYRLLFWFLFFMGFSLIMLVHSLVYMEKQEVLRKEEDAVRMAFASFQETLFEEQRYFPVVPGIEAPQPSASQFDGYHRSLDSIRNSLEHVELPDVPGVRGAYLETIAGIKATDSLLVLMGDTARQGGEPGIYQGDLLEESRQAMEAFSLLLDRTQQWRTGQMQTLGRNYLLIGAGLLLVCIFLSAWIAGRITRPLRHLNQEIKEYVESNFHRNPELPPGESDDEIADLGRSFLALSEVVRSRMDFFDDKMRSRTGELADANDRLVQLAEANSRFVPDEFLDHLGKEGIEEVSLGDHVERRMTIMFTDIREFTQLSESLDPQENFDFINTYLKGIVPLIQRQGGFIDKFIGDSVMALFPESAEGAIRAAFAIEEFLEDFNTRLKERGMNPVHTGTGIHTGDLILGTIGHANRLETTVISDAVNTAARVEGLSKNYQAKVVVTEASLQTLEDPDVFHFRFLDRVKVKGKRKAVGVYEFLSPLETGKIESKPQYNRAIGMVREGNIEGARDLLFELREQYPEDLAIRTMYQRCMAHLQDGSSTWNDITQIIP